MTESTWREFVDRRFPLRFRYPEMSPQGYATDIKETIVGEGVRIHLTSAESREIYFEVSRFPNISVEESYQKLKEEIVERFAGKVSLLTPTTFVGQPAFEMSFQWADNQRLVAFVPADGVVYRILCNPTSELNMQIRSTVEFN
jgi:hypothetical protein